MKQSFWYKILRITLPTLICIFLFFELIVFRFLVPASEWPYRYAIRNGNDAARYEYKDAPMYHTGTQRLGFPARYASRYSINHEGWNSTKEYTPEKSGKKRIVVIGDSFVDAFQVNVDQCFAELLEKNLSPSVDPDEGRIFLNSEQTLTVKKMLCNCSSSLTKAPSYK